MKSNKNLYKQLFYTQKITKAIVHLHSPHTVVVKGTEKKENSTATTDPSEKEERKDHRFDSVSSNQHTPLQMVENPKKIKNKSYVKH